MGCLRKRLSLFSAQVWKLVPPCGQGWEAFVLILNNLCPSAQGSGAVSRPGVESQAGLRHFSRSMNVRRLLIMQRFPCVPNEVLIELK